MIRSEQNQIRELCTEQSFQRGLRYFEEGRVKIKEASSSQIVATVIGTDSYRVEIDLDDFSAVCNCPYDLEGYCKHIVSAFLAVDNVSEKVDRIMDDGFDSLKELCTSKEDLEYWKVRMEPHLPEKLPDEKQDWSRYHRAKELISMRLYLLSRLKETAGFYALMDEHYRSSEDLCLQFAQQRLLDGDRTKAIKIAEEGIALFPDHSSRYLRDFLSENYKETNPEKYKEQLLSLFS